LKGKAVAAAVAVLAAAVIMKWEDVRYSPYQDSVGVWTVCYGHTKTVQPGRSYTKAECAALLEIDMAEANGHVNRCLPMPKLVQVEAALTSLVFNVGPRGVCGSTIQRKALANDWPGACAGLDAWKYAGGRVLRGLELRRGDERRMCETGSWG
jgi:lysozyme